jgi:hypothetical protein
MTALKKTLYKSWLDKVLYMTGGYLNNEFAIISTREGMPNKPGINCPRDK